MGAARLGAAQQARQQATQAIMSGIGQIAGGAGQYFGDNAFKEENPWEIED